MVRCFTSRHPQHSGAAAGTLYQHPGGRQRATNERHRCQLLALSAVTGWTGRLSSEPPGDAAPLAVGGVTGPGE